MNQGTHYKETSLFQFEIDLKNESHYVKVFAKIKAKVQNPIVFHCFSSDSIKNEKINTAQIDKQLDKGFYSLLNITQAYIKEIGGDIPMKCIVIASGSYNILGKDTMCPVNASLIGACRVVPMEQPSMHYQFIDIEPKDFKEHSKMCLLDIISLCLNEKWNSNQPVIAYRNGYNWDISYARNQQKSPFSQFF